LELRGKARVPVPEDIIKNTDFYAVDISETGIKMRSHERVRKGKFINLLLTIDNTDVLISGEVMWCREGNSIYDTDWVIGLQFVEYSITAQLAIRNYVIARLAAKTQKKKPVAIK